MITLIGITKKDSMYLNATGKRLPALQLMIPDMEGSERRYEKDRKTKICRSAVYKKLVKNTTTYVMINQ